MISLQNMREEEKKERKKERERGREELNCWTQTLVTGYASHTFASS